MHPESGDYFNIDGDYELQTAVLRLQSYAQALRNKLETEKLWLASLKSETQLLLAQKGSPFPDGRHLPQCPMSNQVSSCSLHHRQRMPSTLQDSSCNLHKQQNMPAILQTSSCSSHHLQKMPTALQVNHARAHPEYAAQVGVTSYVPLDPYPEGFKVGNVCQPFNENVCNSSYPQNLPNEEMQKLAERQNYLQKLVELDNLCKQEMARISQVGYELEPLNQLASDWNFQAQLSNPKTSVKEYITMAMADSNLQNQSSDVHLFVQTNCDAEKTETDFRQFQSVLCDVDINANVPQRINSSLDTSPQELTSFTQTSKKCELDLNSESPVRESEMSQSPLTTFTIEDMTRAPERDTVGRKVLLRKGVTFLPHKDEKDSQSFHHNPTVNFECTNKIKSDKKEKKPAHNSDVAPIVWGRLEVDKRKKKLKQSLSRDSDSYDDRSLKGSSREVTDVDSSEEDADSGDNHFASAVEREFLRKYMSSDSNYVYSPLFISESEEST